MFFFLPLRRDTGLRGVETWSGSVFPRGGCAFSRGGVFSHVQGEVFFLAALDTCWLPPRISVGICTPESCLLMPPLPSPPTPLETLEVVCSQRVTLGHHMTQGGAWEAARKSQPPSPPPPQRSMSIPRGTSQGVAFPRRQAQAPCGGRRRPCLPVLPGNLSSHGSRTRI